MLRLASQVALLWLLFWVGSGLTALLGSAATMTAVVGPAALGGVAAAVLPALALKSATAFVC